MMLQHEEKLHLIEVALQTLRDSNKLDETESLSAEEWVSWYDRAMPRTTDIKTLASEMEIEQVRRRGRRLEAQGEQRGGDHGNQYSAKVEPGSTLPQAERDRRKEARLLARHPEAVDEYLDTERKAGRMRTKKGAVRHVQRGKTTPKVKATSPKSVVEQPQRLFAGVRGDDHRQRILVALEKVADGQPRSDQALQRLIGSAPDDFIRYVRFIPWVTMLRPSPGSTTFTIDQDLRNICQDLAPRPILDGFSVRGFLTHLRTEIVRRRKENADAARSARWNPDGINKREQSDLLDWIETQLGRIPH